MLGGFWTRPEILDVVAWLRVLDDPGDNLALARLLLGPAYRLSRRDLFFLADRAKDENQRRLRYGDRDVLPYALADAIVAHDGDRRALGRGARAASRPSTRPGASSRRSPTRVSLADLVGEIARVIRPGGRARRLAGSRGGARSAPPREAARPRAGLPAGRGLARPRRLRRLPRLARGVRPGRGRAARDRGERGPADDPSPREGPRVGHVFLPGLAQGTMPHRGKGANNPADAKWQRLPFELRGDRDFLPTPTTKADLDRLRDEEERRLMYVGITRAQPAARALARLVLPGQHPREAPSPYWDEALDDGARGHARGGSTARPRTRIRARSRDGAAASRRAAASAVRRTEAEIARIEAELERLRGGAKRRHRERRRGAAVDASR